MRAAVASSALAGIAARSCRNRKINPSSFQARDKPASQPVSSGSGSKLPITPTGVPLGIGPICRSPFAVKTPGNSHPSGPRSALTYQGRKPDGTLTQLVEVVRWIRPTPLLPSLSSCVRFSGHNICSTLAWNTAIRAATEGFGSNGPTVLLSKKGAVDHRLISEGGLVYPRPPAGMLNL